MSFPPAASSGLADSVGRQISGQVRLRRANARRAEVLALLIAGMSRAEIGRRLGVSPRTVAGDLAMLQDERIQVADIIEDAGLDADDVHITLSKMHDADLADIVENPGDPIEQLRYKPIGQWPDIWRQGLAGKVKVTPVTLPDGERTPGGDSIGYKVEVERESLLKILELAARLKAVDALVKQHGDTTINVSITAQQQRLDRARKRLEQVIDLPAVPEVTDTSGAGWLPPGAKT